MFFVTADKKMDRGKMLERDRFSDSVANLSKLTGILSSEQEI